MIFDADDGATPFTPQEREWLIPTYITTKRELNEAEQRNIAEADIWYFGSARRRRNVLNEQFLKRSASPDARQGLALGR